MLEYFESYLLKEKRSSIHTVAAYLNDVQDFLSFSEVTNKNQLKEIDYQLVRSWMVHLINNDNSNRSVNRKLSSLRTFFKWGKRNEWIEVDPMLRIRGPKQEKRLPEFIKEQELTLDKIQDLFSNDEKGGRDQLMIEVFYQTGMRLSELINLKERSIEGDGFRVLGKRNKERIIPISETLLVEIKDFISNKKEKGLSGEYLFFTDKGEKLYPKFVYRKINYYLSQVTNLSKKSPHILRHSFATHMLNNGAGLETLKELLGHANLSATQIYTHNSFDEINKVYKQAHPRGHKND